MGRIYLKYLAVYLSVLISTTLVVLSLLLPAASSAAVADREPVASQGVSVINPGAELWREVRQRDLALVGTSQVKGVDTGVLINIQGDRWARFRADNPVKHAPSVLAAVIVLVLLFYALRGKVGIEGGLSGRMVKRFTDYERIVHWTLAILFLFLAITGLILLIGRPL